jgi:hypothetical protein
MLGASAVEQILDSTFDPSVQSEELLPVVDVYIPILAQVDRYAHALPDPDGKRRTERIDAEWADSNPREPLPIRR